MYHQYFYKNLFNLKKIIQKMKKILFYTILILVTACASTTKEKKPIGGTWKPIVFQLDIMQQSAPFDNPEEILVIEGACPNLTVKYIKGEKGETTTHTFEKAQCNGNQDEISYEDPEGLMIPSDSYKLSYNLKLSPNGDTLSGICTHSEPDVAWKTGKVVFVRK
jgi:hypothetical protein